MRLTTWNVNGIRNPFSYPPWNNARTFPAMFDILESDIIVMQELKIQRKDLKDDMVLLDGWDCYFSLPKHKKGYSGVAIYTRNAKCAPIKAEEGLLGVLPSPSGLPYRDLPTEQSIGGYPIDSQIADLSVDVAALDAEGRCVALEFPAFVLLGVYSPANSNGLRDDFRHAFIQVLDCRVRNLIKAGKRVVLVGDLNVSRGEIDSASALDDIRKSGITHEEFISTPNRRIFNQLLLDGEVIGERDPGRDAGVLWDTTRAFHPDRRGMYTHWEQKINARPGNFGGRIDFVLVADGMQSWIQAADIQEGLLGSDHCPVYVDFKEKVNIDDEENTLVDIMSPQGVHKDSSRRVEWRVSEIPAFSARRLPEFDKRRSIKSMFAIPRTGSRISPGKDKVGSQHMNTTSPTGSQLRSDDSLEAKERRLLQNLHEDISIGPIVPKRKASSVGERSTKHAKIESKTEALATANKGQQTLTGFFKTSSTPPGNAHKLPSTQNTQKRQSLNRFEELADDATLQVQSWEDDESTKNSQISQIRSGSVSPTPSMVESQFAMAEETQRSWNSLFSRPVAPLCESHNEPCKTMLTKKKGSNQGRSFWMCARPLGPSGNKERGTQWRCPTFVWCSEWDGKQEK